MPSVILLPFLYSSPARLAAHGFLRYVDIYARIYTICRKGRDIYIYILDDTVIPMEGVYIYTYIEFYRSAILSKFAYLYGRDVSCGTFAPSAEEVIKLTISGAAIVLDFIEGKALIFVAFYFGWRTRRVFCEKFCVEYIYIYVRLAVKGDDNNNRKF